MWEDGGTIVETAPTLYKSDVELSKFRSFTNSPRSVNYLTFHAGWTKLCKIHQGGGQFFTLEWFYRPDFHRGTLQHEFSRSTKTGCIACTQNHVFNNDLFSTDCRKNFHWFCRQHNIIFLREKYEFLYTD